jgi:hypothetical protein
MYCQLNKNKLETAMNACHMAIRLRQNQIKQIDAELGIKTRENPIDQRLISIIGEEQEQIDGGMAGAAQIFLKMIDPSAYKKAAARHLLKLRHIRRWNMAHLGKPLSIKKSQEILASASFCRRRAAGLDPMPNVKAIG